MFRVMSQHERPGFVHLAHSPFHCKAGVDLDPDTPTEQRINPLHSCWWLVLVIRSRPVGDVADGARLFRLWPVLAGGTVRQTSDEPHTAFQRVTIFLGIGLFSLNLEKDERRVLFPLLRQRFPSATKLEKFVYLPSNMKKFLNFPPISSYKKAI